MKATCTYRRHEHNPHSAFRSAATRPPAPDDEHYGVKTDNFSPTRSEAGDLHYGHGEAVQTARRMRTESETCWTKQRSVCPRNRARFAAKNQLVLDWSPAPARQNHPADGKPQERRESRLRAVKSDQQTVNDAARITRHGFGDSVNTGKALHLDE